MGAGWALRGSKRRTYGVTKEKVKVNPFVDFINNLDGPAKGLRAAVLSTDAGEKHFQNSLKEESNRFHFDYMKHEIREEDLHDARVIHCEQGRNLIEKQRREREIRQSLRLRKNMYGESEAEQKRQLVFP